MAAQATKADLKRTALDHYEKVSSAAHEWHSVIPRAITAFYDNDDEHQRLKDAVVEAAKAWRTNGSLHDDLEPVERAIDDLLQFEQGHPK